MEDDAFTDTLRLIAESIHRPHRAPGRTPRVVIAGPRWTPVCALARATLRAWLDVPLTLPATNLASAAAQLPADLLLVDVQLAAEQATELARLREEWPGVPVAALADRPDEETAACLRTAGLDYIVLATDGETATALRLRCLLERRTGHASAPAPEPATPAAAHASGVLRQLAEQLVPERHRPGVDGVTGLPDRPALEDRLDAEITRATRTGDALALVLVGVDGLGVYGERHGRDAAGALLRLLVAGWRTPLRGNDFLARVGADEFAILLPACGQHDAERIAERLHVEAGGLASFAVAVSPWDGRSSAACTLTCAASALAQARASR